MPLPELDRPGAPPAKAARLGVERSGREAQFRAAAGGVVRGGGFQWSGWQLAGEAWRPGAGALAGAAQVWLAGLSQKGGHPSYLRRRHLAHAWMASRIHLMQQAQVPSGKPSRHLGISACPVSASPACPPARHALSNARRCCSPCRTSSVHRPATERASYPPPISTCLGAGSASRLLLRRERGSEGQGGRAWGAASSAALKRPGSANCFFATPPRAGPPSRNAPRAWPAGTGRDFSSSCGLTFTKKATLRDCEACPRDA